MPLISFSGYQSTGKTTATMQLAADLKKKGKSVGMWADLPRECPLGINEHNTARTQLWIAGKMLCRTEELLSLYDYVVTDRSLFDTVLYEMSLRSNSTLSRVLFDVSSVFAKEHNQTILWVTDGYDHIYERGRTENLAFNTSCLIYADNVLARLKATDIDVREVDLRKPIDVADLI